MVRQWFAGISLFPLIAFALAQSADAADLYRVRFEPASNAVAGETLVVDVVLDNSSWPPHCLANQPHPIPCLGSRSAFPSRPA